LDAGVIEAVSILVALYLPGHFLGGIAVRKGHGWAELALLRLAASAGVATPVLVALALLGRFQTPFILGALLLCAVLAWALARGERLQVRPGRWDLGALALVLGAFALYARPAEYLINNRDPGVYAIIAAKLARTGELLTRDPLVAAVLPFHPFADGKKYPGFYIHGTDLIVPQFMPGPFAWVGVGNVIGGVSASLYVVPVFGALAVGMAYLLGRELFGRWAGMLGAALLAASYTQVWWARQPSSEVLAQFFVLAGLLLAARFARGAGPGTGALAGTLLGSALLVRVDAFVAWVGIIILFAHLLLVRRPARRWLWVGAPLALSGAAAALYLGTFGSHYVRILHEDHGLDRALQLAPPLAVAALVCGGGLLTARRRWGAGLGRWLEARGGRLALAGALALLAAVLWAYFVFPEPWESLDPRRGFNEYRSQVVVRMVWFLTPAVAVLGAAGFALAARRLDSARAVFLAAVLAFGLLYALLPNVAPDLPWATRRFVPAVFPGICLIAGYAVVEAGRFLESRFGFRAGVAGSGALAALALAGTVWTALPVLEVRELAGSGEQLERLERAIPEAEVVFVELPDRFDHYGSPLEYVYGRPVMPYDRERFVEESAELSAAGLLRDAVYVTVDGEPAPRIRGFALREVGSESLSLPRLKREYDRLPTETGRLEASFRIFRVEER
jgi:hypothetical protein